MYGMVWYGIVLYCIVCMYIYMYIYLSIYIYIDMGIWIAMDSSQITLNLQDSAHD